MNFEEHVIYGMDTHLTILLHGRPDYEANVAKSFANHIIEEFPEYAARRGLVADYAHEYWRP